MKYAAITAIPLSLLFLWADRFRPQRFWVWLMTFGWGACVATFISAQVNTWAAQHLSIIGDGDPATAARAAIYVAPFVEEASKASVLFWLAILMRYQWVSRLSGIVLAGLSGAAFAFTENILYYGRVYRYAARTFGEVPPLEALQEPLRDARSDHLLRPSTLHRNDWRRAGDRAAFQEQDRPCGRTAAGYGVAVFLHMAFNTTATLVQGSSLLFIYLGVALPLVIGMIIFVVRQLFREGRLIRERLVDYVRVGWLPETDPRAMSRLRTRLRALWHAVFAGPETFLATIRMQRAITELAYLRDALTRGIIDDTGRVREKELLAKIRSIRGKAIIQPEGRAAYPSLRRRRTSAIAAYPPPSYPGPAGLGGNYPAPKRVPGADRPAAGRAGCGFGALGASATQYSEVDPTWKPPGE